MRDSTSLKLVFAIIANFQFLLFQFWLRAQEVSPDFIVFYETTKRFLSGESVFFPDEGKVGYAPTLVYLFLSPLSLLDVSTASKIFIIFNYVLILSLSLFLSQYLSLYHVAIALTIINVAFSSRSIINNGQIGLIVLVLQVLYILLLRNQSKKSLFIRTFILYMVWEFKPYLILPYLIYLLLKRRTEIIYLLGFFLLFQSLFLAINPSSTVVQYAKLVLSRASGAGGELDQSSFLYLSGNNIFAFCIFTLAILTLIRRKFPKSETNRAVLLFLAAPLVSIYFHRQDTIFAVLVFALIICKINEYAALTITFLLIHPGSYNPYFAVQLGLMFLAIALLVPFKAKRAFALIVCFALFNYWMDQINAADSFFGTYEIWTIVVFIFQFLVFMVTLRYVNLGGNPVELNAKK